MASEATALVRRCAWCDRIFSGDWWEEDRDAERADARETATICPDCADELRALDFSR